MAISPEFADHLRDLFGALGPVETRRMFGGAGLYLGDAMIALVIDDTLYMKADPDLARTYAEAGSAPFSYDTRNGVRTIPGLMRRPTAPSTTPTRHWTGHSARWYQRNWRRRKSGRRKPARRQGASAVSACHRGPAAGIHHPGPARLKPKPQSTEKT